MKIVIDLETEKYVRLMIGNTQYDLSSYSLRTGTIGLAGDTYFNIEADGVSAINKNAVIVAYVIISGDEP